MCYVFGGMHIREDTIDRHRQHHRVSGGYQSSRVIVIVIVIGFDCEIGSGDPDCPKPLIITPAALEASREHHRHGNMMISYGQYGKPIKP
jgi:hypothetical protein